MFWKFLKSFRSYHKQTLKNGGGVAIFIQNPQSPVIRQRRLLCPLWLLSFSLMLGWETIPHMKDESLQSFLFLLCFTQGLGLSTHTKWEVSGRLLSMSDGWKEKKRMNEFQRKGSRQVEPCGEGSLTLNLTSWIKDKVFALQFTKLDNHLALFLSVFVTQYETQIPSWRKLTFTCKKFTLMKDTYNLDPPERWMEFYFKSF